MRRRMVRPTVVLPHPTLADQAERLAGDDVEADVVDGLDVPDDVSKRRRADREPCLEIAHFQQRRPLSAPASAHVRAGHGRRERVR